MSLSFEYLVRHEAANRCGQGRQDGSSASPVLRRLSELSWGQPTRKVGWNERCGRYQGLPGLN